MLEGLTQMDSTIALLLGKVIKKTRLLTDVQAGPQPSEAPHPLPSLECLPLPLLEAAPRTEPGDNDVMLRTPTRFM